MRECFYVTGTRPHQMKFVGSCPLSHFLRDASTSPRITLGSSHGLLSRDRKDDPKDYYLGDERLTLPQSKKECWEVESNRQQESEESRTLFFTFWILLSCLYGGHITP